MSPPRKIRPGVYPPAQSAQGLPNPAIASAWRAALPFKKQQKTTRPTTGARASASTTVETAIRAARSAGKRKKPGGKAGKGKEDKPAGRGQRRRGAREEAHPRATP